MLLAVVLDREMRGSRFYQTAFYMPVVLSLALIGFIWQLFYSRDQGLINEVFNTQVDWYGDPNINLWAVLVATAWRHTGYIMLLYLAGLKGVDASLREAAAVDGANEVQTFFRVDLPGDAADQHDRPGDRGHRVAAGLRPGLGDQQGPQRAGDHRRAGQPERHRRGDPVRLRLGARGDHDADLVGVHHDLPAHRLQGGAAR